MLTRLKTSRWYVLLLFIWGGACQPATPVPTPTPLPVTPTVLSIASTPTNPPPTGTPEPAGAPELAGTPEPAGTTRATRPAPSPTARRELMLQTRALWSWVGRTARTPADVDALVAQLDAARLNVILLGVYRDGAAYFEPSRERFPVAAERLVSQSRFEGLGHPDALSYLLAVRDERLADDDPTNDFEVHAWFTVHRGGDADTSWPRTDLTEPYMLNAIFPEFRLKFGTYYTRQDARYLHPAISVVQQPRFQHYMADLIAGLAEDYDVDGVQLDYIRTGALCFNGEALNYPGTEYDYVGCQADYEAWTLETYGRAYTLWDDTDGVRLATEAGAERIAGWQAHSVAQLVRTIYAEVKAVDPGLVVSVASVNNVPENLPVQGQAAWVWLDEGWVDAVFPTLYLDSTEAIVERVGRLRAVVQNESRRSLFFPGLATYAFEGRDLWTDLLVERTCALLCDADAGAPAEGVALFRSEYLSPEALTGLANQTFLEPARPYWGADVAAARRQTSGETANGQ